MNTSKYAGGFLSDARCFGTLATIHDRIYWRLQATTGYLAFAVVVIEERDLVRRDYLERHPRYEARFIEPEQVFAHSSANAQLTSEFVRGALARGDLCYGILDGGAVAACGWYSTVPTPIEHGLSFGFGSGWVYMHAGFTDPEYRGQRLHGIGMSHALRELTAMGHRGLVSLVETDNRASLRSCERMGYRVVGHIRTVPFGRRAQVRVSAGCRRYGASLFSPGHIAARQRVA